MFPFSCEQFCDLPLTVVKKLVGLRQQMRTLTLFFTAGENMMWAAGLLTAVMEQVLNELPRTGWARAAGAVIKN